MGKALDFYKKNKNTIPKIVYWIAAALVSFGLNIFVASRAVIGIEAETISAQVGFFMILITAAICVISSAIIYRKVFAQEVETGEIAGPDSGPQEFRPDPGLQEINQNSLAYEITQVKGPQEIMLEQRLKEISNLINAINGSPVINQMPPTNASTQQQSLFGGDKKISYDNKIISFTNKRGILEAVKAGNTKELGNIQYKILKGSDKKLKKYIKDHPGANLEEVLSSMHEVSTKVNQMITKAMDLAKYASKSQKVRGSKGGVHKRSKAAVQSQKVKSRNAARESRSMPLKAAQLKTGSLLEATNSKPKAAKGKKGLNIDASAADAAGETAGVFASICSLLSGR